MIEKSNPTNKTNAKTVRYRKTAADIVEAAADGDDDDEEGNFQARRFLLHNRSSEEDRVQGGQYPYCNLSSLTMSATSESPERLFSSVGLVKNDLRGRLLETTLIDVMWAKQAP